MSAEVTAWHLAGRHTWPRSCWFRRFRAVLCSCTQHWRLMYGRESVSTMRRYIRGAFCVVVRDRPKLTRCSLAVAASRSNVRAVASCDYAGLLRCRRCSSACTYERVCETMQGCPKQQCSRTPLVHKRARHWMDIAAKHGKRRVRRPHRRLDTGSLHHRWHLHHAVGCSHRRV